MVLAFRTAQDIDSYNKISVNPQQLVEPPGKCGLNLLPVEKWLTVMFPNNSVFDLCGAAAANIDSSIL